MKFNISNQHKSRGRRNAILAALLLPVLILGFVLMLINSQDLSDKLIAVVGIFLLARYLPHAYRAVKNHDSSYPQIEVLQAENRIDISHKGAVISMPLSDIEKLRVQYRKGKVASILLSSTAFSNLRFEGYDDMAQLAELLKKHTRPEHVQVATWYHR